MEEKKCCVTFSKVTAILCVLVMLVSVLAFFGSEQTAKIVLLNEQIANREQEILVKEEYIAQREQDIVDYRQLKQQEEADFVAAQDALLQATADESAKEDALDQAEANLDKVCSRSYYSSWYCKNGCKSLHDAVTSCSNALDTAEATVESCQFTVNTITGNIENLEENIKTAEQDIADSQLHIEELKAEIKERSGKLVGAWFVLIFKIFAMLAALGALGLLVKNFYAEEENNFTLYAVAGLAGSSLLFLITGAVDNVLFKNSAILYLLLTPHSWNIAVMALLAAVLMDKTEKPVMFRNIAVTLSVIVGVLTVLSGAPICGVLYAAAAICIAFVIVPLVFTEYIDIAKHIFLSIITFGIWQLVWIYHVTKNLNNVATVENRKPARELLLCMLLPFYYPYWLYKTAEGVEDYGMEKGKEFKIDILCIAFAFVCPLFATVLIQNKINVVAGKPTAEEPAE